MSAKPVDASTLKRWLETGEAVLVDVREPGEHAAEAIPGATLLPLGQVSAAALPPLTGRKLVVHCRKGGRGGTACEKLMAENPQLDVYNLEGGITAWAAAGLPVQSSAHPTGKKMLPLDRQVQLTIGGGILLGVLLSVMFSPVWIVLPAFFGAGLVYAGLSGTCGLALVLAKMPWNAVKTEGDEGRFCQTR